MTIQELNVRLERVVRQLSGGPELGNIMVGAGSSALEMIRSRVIETGVNPKGQKYTPYSTDPMLANCSSMTTSACSKIAGSKTKRRDLKWVTLKRGERAIRLFEIPGGYKQYRELHGRQTGYVNFSFTNRMWDNIKLTSEASEHNRGIARIGATEEKEQKKLAGNTERRGEILMLSSGELNEISGYFNSEIDKILKNSGL